MNESPSWWYRVIMLLDRGLDVEIVQRKLGADITGEYDDATAGLVRGLQKAAGLPATGEVDEDTAAEIGESARAGLPPLWYHRPLHLWNEGDDVRQLREAMRAPDGSVFDRCLERLVRRLQSANNLPLTGVVDEATVLAVK